MNCTSLLAAAGLVISLLVGAGCKPTEGPVTSGIPAEIDYERQLPPGAFALRKLPPDQYPDFTFAFSNTGGLREAIQRSLNYLGKGSAGRFYPYSASATEKISREQVVATLNEFLRMLDGGLTSAQMSAAVRAKFDVYMSVGCDDEGKVLFTGYYTPIFDASPARTEKFRFPLYRQPEDLVKEPGTEGRIVGRRDAGGGTVPYYTREEIEKGNLLAGKELYWLGDEFEAYIVTVQGSAKLRMPDGKLVTIGYAASNGHDYNSVGKLMAAEGKVAKGKLSLQAMIDYFKAHPNEVRQYTWKNPRTVFFQNSADEDPRGSLNEPVTRLRSVATDKTIFPRASMTFLATGLPMRSNGEIVIRAYTGFALDQDTGGAIRAAGRCDVYMGIGDENGRLAGRTYEEGKLYYIFLKPQFVTGTPAGPLVPIRPAPAGATTPPAVPTGGVNP